jgi:hypothetical protein
MVTVVANIPISGNTEWIFFENPEIDPEEGITFSFSFPIITDKRIAFQRLRDQLKLAKINWIYNDNGNWFINLNKVRKNFKQFEKNDWLKGILIIEPDVEIKYEFVNKIIIKFVLTKEYVMCQYPSKIFLSHKGVDKPIVREFKNTLGLFGFSPWFDEDSLVAGDELERSLLTGFKDSCAAIFFITSSFNDENYLASEINYAISEKREKKERFSIITIVLDSENSNKIIIPDLLKQYVWKRPKNYLEALREIIRALPVEVGKIQWKKTL